MPIIIAKSDEQILSTYPLMKQLRPHLKKENYLEQIKTLQSDDGYRLIVYMEDETPKAAAGYRMAKNLAWDKHIYVDDLITDVQSRGRGYAEDLFNWLEEEVKRNNCVALHLDSGVQRHDAHRFYLNRKMNISSHHFQKTYS